VADTWNLVLLIVRVWLGVMIFAHGADHLLRTIRGQGTANYYEGLGIRPGKVHAWSVAITELVIAELLVAGLLTPVAAGVFGALMLVSLVTDNRTKGFFVTDRTQGFEYVVTAGVLALALGALSPGEWSLDEAVGLAFPFQAPDAMIITGLVALGVAGIFLALFWRPQKTQAKPKVQAPTAKAA